MEGGEDFGWISLLQRRADYVRKAAAGAKSADVTKEYEELASLYEDVMERAMKPGNTSEARNELVRYLQMRSAQFLRDSHGDPGKRGDDLKYLAGIFGAEAARLKNDGVR